MILGTGIDIIEISRIKKIISKSNFLNKVFTDRENAYLSNKNPESTAGYFCAKEAVAKALGTGFSGFSFTDIEILKNNGAPYVCLHNRAHEIAANRGIDAVNISISHCREYANALAIAEGKGLKNDTNFKVPVNIIKKRDEDGHKGDYGRIYIIGGSYGMSGAIALAAKAAFRAGAGLVTCVLPPSILDRVGGSLIEATFFVGEEEEGFLLLTNNELESIISKSSVIAVGIGMGQSSNGSKILDYLLKHSDKPMVIDADGINMLSGQKKLLKESKANIVLTPHTGEMARLMNRDIEYINNNREFVAIEFAREFQCVILLKGHKTIVTDGERLYINSTGNPGMASGGSGDVLTGIIASLIGQGYEGYEAAALGAYIHGYGGDVAFDKYGYGLMASDIIDNIGECLKV